MPGDLTHSIARTDPRLLLPSGATAPQRLTLVDALRLPAGGPELLLALAADDEERCHVLPLVDDRGGLRRAREGDGWASAVADAVGRSGSDVGGFQVRRRRFERSDAGGLVSEVVLDANHEREIIGVGEDLRVRVSLQPESFHAALVDVVDHLVQSEFIGLCGAAGDIVWSDSERSVSPMVGVGHTLAGRRLDEAFGRAASTHLLGGTDPEPTFQLVDALASTLAGLHLALATPTGVIGSPVTTMTAPETAEWTRRSRDAISEATLVAGPQTQEALRSRRGALRRALESLASSEGSALLPAAPFRSLTQAQATDDGAVRLDPLELTTHRPTRPPVADVAALLRHLDHLTFGALRRLVGMGESVPVERALTWTQAVREALLDRYRDLLVQESNVALFDEGLLLAFEITTECEALTYAARNLSTWSTVPEVGLLDLLPPD